MKKLQKWIGLILCCTMLLSLCSPCLAETEAEPLYDRKKVAAGDADYIAGLTEEQIAAILLDRIDRELVLHTDDFEAFNESLSPEISVEITGLESLFSYAAYKEQLGGDFAELDTSALSGLKRADGDLAFLNGILQFISTNAGVLSKVFYTDDEKRFDYGTVGDYIEGLEEDTDIRVFYETFLQGVDLRESLKDSLGDVLGYTVQEEDTVDDVLQNGVLNLVISFLTENGLLTENGVERVKNELNLKTTDAYTLFRALVGIVQEDNADAWSTRYVYYLENLIRPVLKVTLGYTMTEGETAALPANPYKDMKELKSLTGGKRVLCKCGDDYYSFTVNDELNITDVKKVSWESEISFAPGDFAIYTGPDGSETEVKTYQTMNEEVAPVIYTAYADKLGETAFAEYLSEEEIPEAVTALMIDDNKTAALQDYLRFYAGQGGNELLNETVTFDEIEKYAEEQAEKLALKELKGALDAAGVTYGEDLAVDVDVTLSYQGWATEDTFVATVSASAVPSFAGQISKSGIPVIGTYTGDITEAITLLQSLEVDVNQMIKDAIDDVVTNPVATVVADRLSMSESESAALALAGLLDTDFEIDESILDFYGNYENHNGVIGQFNDIVCKMTKMFTSDDGYTDLALTEGGNENLTANLQKLCDKGLALMSLAKQYVELKDFKSLTDGLNVNAYFASDHGFNAAMVYNLDFSEVENLYVCGIRLISDFAVPDTSTSVFHDIHEAVEYEETLEQMTDSVTEILLKRVNDALTVRFAADGYNYAIPVIDIAVTEENCKGVVMGKVTDFLLYASDFAVDKLLNRTLNDLIDKYYTGLGTDRPTTFRTAFTFGVSVGEDWESTLTAMTDRFYELADGFVIPMTGYENTDLFDRLSNMACALIPMGSLFSNCASDSFCCDLGDMMDIVFDEVVDGNMDNFLRLFETATKTKDILDCDSATMAIITASEYVMDSIFPDTIEKEEYTLSDTLLDGFASDEGIVLIAENNMVSINSCKDNFLPGIMRLLREADILPFLCSCDGDMHDWEEVAEKKSTCTVAGYSAHQVCTVCGERSGYTEYQLDPDHHTGEEVTYQAPTCNQPGHNAGTRCSECGTVLSGCEVLPAAHQNITHYVETTSTCTVAGHSAYDHCNDCHTDIGRTDYPLAAHSDADYDGKCDVCGTTTATSFGDKIGNFFKRIGLWFKNLFK